MVEIGLQWAIIMGWIDNLLCRFSNFGLSTQSFWLHNMNMWLFKLISSHYRWSTKMNKVLYIILISLFSLTVISCAKKSSTSSSSTTTDNTTTSGAVTTVAGTGSSGSANGTGTSASFYNPIGITRDGTNLYVADSYNHLIRKIE